VLNVFNEYVVLNVFYNNNVSLCSLSFCAAIRYTLYAIQRVYSTKVSLHRFTVLTPACSRHSCQFLIFRRGMVHPFVCSASYVRLLSYFLRALTHYKYCIVQNLS
jgi:hypothetical protein